MKKWISWLLATCSALCFFGCGEVEEEPPVTACSHAWGSWKNVKAPTCQENGVKERECSLCGETETGALVNPSMHDFQTMPKKEPGCLEEGCKAYVYCAREGCSYSGKKDSDILAPLGHNWVGYGCSECDERTSEYYLTNFSRGFDNETITSYSRVDSLTTGSLKPSCTEYFTWQYDHGNQNFRLLHREGYDGIYWRKGGLTLDFETDTFRFLCTDMHQDLGDAKMQIFMIIKTASGQVKTETLTLESKTPKSGGWYECVVKIPNGVKAKTVVSLYFHADAFNVDDIRAVNNG